jgi:hypothetical protein
VHKGIAYPGEHAAIVERRLWDRVHDIIQDSPRKRAMRTRAQMPALLKGLIFGPTGGAMTPSHTRRNHRTRLSSKCRTGRVLFRTLDAVMGPGPSDRRQLRTHQRKSSMNQEITNGPIL